MYRIRLQPVSAASTALCRSSVSSWVGTAWTISGFVRTATGTVTTISAPDSVYTSAQGVNDAAQIIAFFSVASRMPATHGFEMP